MAPVSPSNDNLTTSSLTSGLSGSVLPSFDSRQSYSLNDSMLTVSLDLVQTTLNSLSSSSESGSTTAKAPDDGSQQGSSDTSIITKITILLVATAVVLIVSYKFVVRLFLGYADRKDEVFPDGISDDEDSAVVKRDPERNFEF